MSDLLSFFAVVLDEEEEAFLDLSWELLDLLLGLVSVLYFLMVVELVPVVGEWVRIVGLGLSEGANVGIG